MSDQVEEETKSKRVHRLIQLSNQLSVQYGNQFLGEVLEVIPERPYKEDPGSGLLMGYADNYLQIVFQADPTEIGKVCRVRIDQVGAEYCHGTLARIL
jgi:threonylcarbamoyladenosine tRNA methylthiotransferase MtaB